MDITEEVKESMDTFRVIPEGKKYDEGKNRMGLVLQGFSNALWEVGRVGTFGANKYSPNSWQNLTNGKERYLDALCRHLFKHLQGEKVDDESGLLHLSHLAWNSLCLLEFELKEKQENIQDLVSNDNENTKYIVKNEDYSKYIGKNAICCFREGKVPVIVLALNKDDNSFELEHCITKQRYSHVEKEMLDFMESEKENE